MIWIILCIILIILIILVIKFRLRKKTPIILYSGRNGGGKSFSMSSDSVYDIVTSYKNWAHINKPVWSWCYLWIPYFNNKRKKSELFGLQEPQLYSTYPIKFRRKHFFFGKWEISKPLTKEIMLLQESIPLNSIVVADEFSSWVNQFEYNEAFSEALNDHIQKWRHYHGNLSHLYIADQCTNNIPIQIRYRCNSAICCLKTRHILKFIHITDYKNIDLTDAIKSVEVIDNDNADTDDKTLKCIRFRLKRIYDDRAYSNRYYYVDKNPLNSKIINSPMKVNECMEKPDKKAKYTTIDYTLKQEKERQTKVNN